MRRVARAIAVSLLLFAHTGLAFADETGSLVTIVRPPRAGGMVGEATTRLEAELKGAGFRVRVVEGIAGSDGRAEVEGGNLTDISQSFATIAILATDRGAVADVWVADHVTKKTLVRRVDVGDPAVDNAASDLAVRSVELLRASLLEVSPSKSELPPDLARWLTAPLPAPTPPPAVLPRTPPPVIRAAPRRAVVPAAPSPTAIAPAREDAPDRGTIEASFGVLFSKDGFGAAPGPILRLGYSIWGDLALRATIAPAAASTHLSAAAGSVALREELAGIDLSFVYRRLAVAPRLALGGGLYHVHVEGQANTPYFGEQHDLYSAFLSAGAGVEAHLARHLALVAEVDAVVFQPDPVVTIVGTEAGRAGRPAFLASIGLAAGF